MFFKLKNIFLFTQASNVALYYIQVYSERSFAPKRSKTHSQAKTITTIYSPLDGNARNHRIQQLCTLSATICGESLQPPPMRPLTVNCLVLLTSTYTLTWCFSVGVHNENGNQTQDVWAAFWGNVP